MTQVAGPLIAYATSGSRPSWRKETLPSVLELFETSAGEPGAGGGGVGWWWKRLFSLPLFQPRAVDNV